MSSLRLKPKPKITCRTGKGGLIQKLVIENKPACL